MDSYEYEDLLEEYKKNLSDAKQNINEMKAKKREAASAQAEYRSALARVETAQRQLYQAQQARYNRSEEDEDSQDAYYEELWAQQMLDDARADCVAARARSQEIVSEMKTIEDRLNQIAGNFSDCAVQAENKKSNQEQASMKATKAAQSSSHGYGLACLKVSAEVLEKNKKLDELISASNKCVGQIRTFLNGSNNDEERALDRDR